MDFEFEERLNSFQDLFLKLLITVDKNVDQYEISYNDDLLWISKHHPTNSSFDISLSISDNEIILFFNEYHEHYENYSDPKKLQEDVAIEAIEALNLLIDSSKIEIVRLFKGSRVFRYILNVTDNDGVEQTFQDLIVGWWGFAFFIPTTQKKVITSFSNTAKMKLK